MLQRIATVGSPDARRFDLMDVYELRARVDGTPVRLRDAADFDRVQERPGFLAARARLTEPLVSFIEDERGFLALRVSALRASADGDEAPDVLHV